MGPLLQPYKLTIKYQPGDKNLADYLSRHPSQEPLRSSRQQRIAEHYVNFIAEISVPKAMSLEDVKNATDKTLLKSMEFVQTGRWFEIDSIHDPYIDVNDRKELQSVCEELACHPDNLLLGGNRIVLPTEPQEKAISFAHEGH